MEHEPVFSQRKWEWTCQRCGAKLSGTEVGAEATHWSRNLHEKLTVENIFDLELGPCPAGEVP